MLYDNSIAMKKTKYIKIIKLFFFFSVLCLFSLFPLSSPAFATTILLDPGHSSIASGVCNPSLSKGLYDDPYGIYDDDYPNCPEITEVMDIASWLNQKLTADGYQVIMTKSAWDTPTFVSLWDRAQKANSSNVDLAVSIHDDHGQSWSNFAQVYTQKTNLFRINKNGSKVTFAQAAGSNAGSIVNKSQQYGAIFASVRSSIEGHTVANTDANFNGRAPLAAGNIPQVQLYAKVPWVYNEVGGQGIDIGKYEQGLLQSIEKAVPSNGGNGTDTQSSNCVVTKVGNPPGQPQLPASCTTGTSGGGNQSVVQLGEKYINNPKYLYVWAAPSGGYLTNNPNAFDCSGFAQWIWYHGTNNKVILPRTTSDAWNNAASYKLQKFLPSQQSQLQPGDLLYFSGGDSPKPGHVGVYTGDSKCGGAQCYMEFANSGQEGDYNSLAKNQTGFYGFLRPMIQ